MGAFLVPKLCLGIEPAGAVRDGRSPKKERRANEIVLATLLPRLRNRVSKTSALIRALPSAPSFGFVTISESIQLSRWLHIYSERSATIGFTRQARRAGIQAARMVTMERSRPTAR